MPSKRTAVAQGSLFESSAGVLADDERGTISYTPAFVPAAVAEAWFQQLRESIEWKAERRRMYDRDVDVPRLTAHFRLVTAEGENAAVPAPIRAAAREVLTRTGVPFTSVGLNRYRDGRDSVAPHNDHLNELVEGFPIGLLSLGATRRMTIRTKEPPRRSLLRRPRERQPPDDELRDPAPLRARRAQGGASGRGTDQPGLSREARTCGVGRRRPPGLLSIDCASWTR